VPDPSTVAAFLYYGYLPRVEPRLFEQPWARVRAADVAASGPDRGVLLDQGVEAFRAACRAALAERPCERHVVPLSGGIDSRLLLGTVLRLAPRDSIDAATFGIPGTHDFDLVPAVAAAAGVRHEVFDLTAWPVTREDLLETARIAPWTFAFEIFYNYLIYRRFGTRPAYWSGSQANSIAGEDQDVSFPDWASGCARWAEETPFQRAIDLTPPGYRPASALPDRPILADSCLNVYEQLFMLVRNPARNDPAQLPPGHDVRTPFLRVEWTDFALRLPRPVRGGARFYHEVAAHAEPDLFLLPVKTYLGLPVHAPPWHVRARRVARRLERDVKRRFPRLVRRRNPKLNHADFDDELRGATPVRAIVEESLARLRESGAVAWLDLPELWRRHQHHEANLGEALALLASLELNLAAGVDGTAPGSAS